MQKILPESTVNPVIVLEVLLVKSLLALYKVVIFALLKEVLFGKEPNALKLLNVTVWIVSSLSVVDPLVALRLNLICPPTAVAYDILAVVAPLVKGRDPLN